MKRNQIMNKHRILRNILISVGAVSALPQLLVAATFITFDPPGSTFTVASAITATGTIIGFYTDASGVMRKRGGTFTIFKPRVVACYTTSW